MSKLVFVFITLAASLHADRLTLDKAVERALAHAPALSIATTEVAMRQSVEFQTTRYPNPIASVTIGDTDEWINSGCKSSDTDVSISVSELIELGGKRSARQWGASSETDAAIWELEGVKLDIYNQVVKGVIDVASAEENVKMAGERLRLAEEVHHSIAAKVEAGRAAPLQQSRAEMVLAKAEITLQKARRYFEVAKKKLATLWGSSEVDFEAVDYPLFDLKPLPAIELLLTQQETLNPDILLWDAQIAQGEAAVALEKAGAIPDLTVTAGYETDDKSWMMGVSFPLPIFDRNQGNITRAAWALCQLYDQQRAALVQLKADLAASYEEVLAAYLQANAFKLRLLASAEGAFKGAQEGYAQGKYNYFELLDAQSIFFEAREEYLESLVEYHSHKADLYRLVGLSDYIQQEECHG